MRAIRGVRRTADRDKEEDKKGKKHTHKGDETLKINI